MSPFLRRSVVFFPGPIQARFDVGWRKRWSLWNFLVSWVRRCWENVAYSAPRHAQGGVIFEFRGFHERFRCFSVRAALINFTEFGVILSFSSFHYCVYLSGTKMHTHEVFSVVLQSQVHRASTCEAHESPLLFLRQTWLVTHAWGKYFAGWVSTGTAGWRSVTLATEFGGKAANYWEYIFVS